MRVPVASLSRGLIDSPGLAAVPGAVKQWAGRYTLRSISTTI